MQNNNKQRYYKIKKLILIIFTCFALVGCGNETNNNPQTHALSIPSGASNENESKSVQPDSTAVDKSDLRGIAYNGSNLYVAVGFMGKILTSTDRITWTARQSGTVKCLWAVTWGGGQFVAVGDEGIILINWTYADSGTSAGLMKVMWDGRQFVASGRGIVLTSADGAGWAGWIVPDIALNNGSGDKILYDIADILWDGKQYIATGGGNFVLTSSNLEKWVTRIPNSLGTGMFCDLTWNSKRYIAVGDHLAMMTSLDGRKWTNEDLRINQIESVDDYYTLCLWSVVWGQDKFIAAGHRGLIITSVDGLDWSIVPPVTRAGLNQVFWDGKQYIAVGYNETIITSADGIKWTINKS